LIGGALGILSLLAIRLGPDVLGTTVEAEDNFGALPGGFP